LRRPPDLVRIDGTNCEHARGDWWILYPSRRRTREPTPRDLEESDMSEIPDTIGPTAEAIVRESRRITPVDTEEVRHLRIQVADPGFGFRFVAGESIGVLVPGHHAAAGPYIRRYSIASREVLPLDAGVDLDLLVRRCFDRDETSGELRPGIASNYLCDARPGDPLTISGPYPSPFVLPLDKRSHLLMLGTGTGVAPFRAFVEEIYARHGDWIGDVRLFFGGYGGLDMRYTNDEATDLPHYYERRTFEAFAALASHPAATSTQALRQGLGENANEAFRLIERPGTFVFLAGQGKVAAVFDEVMAERAGSLAAWQGIKARLIAARRWSELLYD